MKRCPSCRSFVPARACPECGRPLLAGRGPTLRALLNVVLSGLAVATLAACSGMTIDPTVPATCADPSTDFDRDGFCGEDDCDESDPDRHVDATDPEGDGVDQNCDGVDGYLAVPDAGPTP